MVKLLIMQTYNPIDYPSNINTMKDPDQFMYIFFENLKNIINFLYFQFRNVTRHTQGKLNGYQLLIAHFISSKSVNRDQNKHILSWKASNLLNETFIPNINGTMMMPSCMRIVWSK